MRQCGSGFGDVRIGATKFGIAPGGGGFVYIEEK